MVSPQLRALAAAAAGAGRIDLARGPATTVTSGRGEHPVCGDEVEVDVAIEGGRVADLRWRAKGCPATYAVAAAAHAALVGKKVVDAASCLRAELARLGDLSPSERHAEALFCRALAQAIAQASRG